MTFSVSGSTITQSGTDNDLSGLSSVSGITHTSIDGYDIYYSTNKKLIVNGTLKIDPEKEILIFDLSVGSQEVTVNNGTLEIGREITENGFTRYSMGVAIRIMRNGNPMSFVVNGSGTLKQYGSIVETGAFVWWQDGSTIEIKNGQWRERGTDASSANRELRITTSTNANINGLLITGFNFITFQKMPATFNGLVATHVRRGAIATSGGTADKTWLNFQDYLGQGNAVDAIIYSDTFIRLRNAVEGTNQKIRGEGSHSNNKGIVEITKQFKLKLTDDAGNVQGAKFYIKDKNNGNRVNFDASNSYTADRSYTGTTAANGETAETEILVGVATRGGSSGRSDTGVGSFNTGVNVVDLRGKTNVLGDDKFDIKIWSYKHDYKVLERAFKGAGVLTITDKLFADTSITEQTKATVDAYTQIDTAAKLYDRAKAYIYDNYAGETATLVTKSGDLIDTGSYNVVIDKTASAPFAFASNTITIKADTYVGNLKTASTVTLSNGATINGVYEDTNGVLVLIRNANPFNALIRVGNSTYKPFQTGITSYSFQVAKGAQVRVAAWQSGKIDVYQAATVNESLTIDLTFVDAEVDDSQDISTYISNITVSYSANSLVLTANAILANLTSQKMKALVHYALGREAALKYLIEENGVKAVEFTDLGIRIRKPEVFIKVNNSVTSGKIETNTYFDVSLAKGISSSYSVNPVNTSNVDFRVLVSAAVADSAAIAVATKNELDATFTKVNEQLKQTLSNQHKLISEPHTTTVNVVADTKEIDDALTRADKKGWSITGAPDSSKTQLVITTESGEAVVSKSFSTTMPNLIYLTLANRSNRSAHYYVTLEIGDKNGVHKTNTQGEIIGSQDAHDFRWIVKKMGIDVSVLNELKSIKFSITTPDADFLWHTLTVPTEIRAIKSYTGAVDLHAPSASQVATELAKADYKIHSNIVEVAGTGVSGVGDFKETPPTPEQIRTEIERNAGMLKGVKDNSDAIKAKTDGLVINAAGAIQSNIVQVAGNNITSVDDFKATSSGGGGADIQSIRAALLSAPAKYVNVQGLSITAANGLYQAVADVSGLTFSGNFNPTGPASSIDTGKPVYRNGDWYIWARQGSGYHISQLSSTTDWWFEQGTGVSFVFANLPRNVVTWHKATGAAPQAGSEISVEINDMDIAAYDAATRGMVLSGLNLAMQMPLPTGD